MKNVAKLIERRYDVVVMFKCFFLFSLSSILASPSRKNNRLITKYESTIEIDEFQKNLYVAKRFEHESISNDDYLSPIYRYVIDIYNEFKILNFFDKEFIL